MFHTEPDCGYSNGTIPAAIAEFALNPQDNPGVNGAVNIEGDMLELKYNPQIKSLLFPLTFNNNSIWLQARKIPSGISTIETIDRLKSITLFRRTGMLSLDRTDLIGTVQLDVVQVTEASENKLNNIKEYILEVGNMEYSTTISAMLSTLLHRPTKIFIRNRGRQAEILVLSNRVTAETILRLLSILPPVLNIYDTMSIEFKAIYQTLGTLEFYETYNQMLRWWELHYKNFKIKERKKNFTEVVEFLNGYYTQGIPEQINEIKNEIRNYEERISERYIRMRALQTTLLFPNIEGEELQALNDFLIDNKYIISLEKTNDYTVRAVFETPAYYYRQDDFETLMNSKNSNRVNGKHKNIYRKLFIEETHAIQLHAVIDFNLRDLTVTAINSGLNQYTGRLVNSFYNPHLLLYNCFGENYTHIVTAMQEQNWIAAISQAIAATGCINVLDSLVFGKFNTRIDTYRDRRCILNRTTGDLTTIQEIDNETNQDQQQ